MPIAKKIVAGTVFAMGTTASNMTTDTYTTIAGARQIPGDLGGTYSVADTTDIDDTIKQDTKTLVDASTLDLEMHEIPDDAGQDKLELAFADSDDVPYNFKVSYPSGDTRHFKAKVLSFQPMVGTASSVRMLRCRLSLTNLSVYAAAP